MADRHGREIDAVPEWLSAWPATDSDRIAYWRFRALSAEARIERLLAEIARFRGGT
jgi:hypothetical protein